MNLGERRRDADGVARGPADELAGIGARLEEERQARELIGAIADARGARCGRRRDPRRVMMLVGDERRLGWRNRGVLMDRRHGADRHRTAGAGERRAARQRRQKENEALHAHGALQIPDHLSRPGTPREKRRRTHSGPAPLECQRPRRRPISVAHLQIGRVWTQGQHILHRRPSGWQPQPL
jgi:hypothetical protein